MKTPPGKFFSRHSDNQWIELIIKFTEFTRNRCFHLYGKQPNYSLVSKIYEPLLDACILKKNRLSLFTANYDPITDAIMDIAESKGIHSYDGFKARGEWNPSQYNKRKTGLYIYRLHGSMSWITQGGRIRNTRDYSLRHGDTEHLLIYPGYKGNPEKEEAHEVFAFSHQALRETLESTINLIVIGYSFRDGHINRIIDEGLKKNKNLHLIVVNTEWPTGHGDFLNKVKKIYLDKVAHVKGSFGESSIMKAIIQFL